jgi:transcriptional regulator with XRE-family HTH domain
LSKSYLNEIEKGKKYPKTDKIILLREIEVSYDSMVSLKLDNNLAPIGNIEIRYFERDSVGSFAYRKMI